MMPILKDPEIERNIMTSLQRKNVRIVQRVNQGYLHCLRNRLVQIVPLITVCARAMKAAITRNVK